jgi:hypothetical protein
MSLIEEITWVNANLALSGRIPPEWLPQLALRLGIDCIVDVRSECCDDPLVCRRCGIALLHLPTPDKQALCPEMLSRGTAWVRTALLRRHKVLIHCEHGTGRSALLAACTLVEMGMDCREALQMLKRRRPCVSPSPEQLQGLLDFVASRAATSGAPAVQVTLEDLFQIAYTAVEAG